MELENMGMEDFEGNGVRRRVQPEYVQMGLISDDNSSSDGDDNSSSDGDEEFHDDKFELVSNLATKAIDKANTEIGPLSKMTKLYSFLSFFLHEGSPLVILFMLFDTFGEPGIPLLINVTASIYFAYIRSTEKYSSTVVKPTGKMFAWETAKKAVSLMFNWIKWGRAEKRKKKMANIRSYVHNCYFSGIVNNLDEFYESELRYITEDREMASYRSFPLAFYYAYLLAHPVNLALPLCELKDVKKLIFILFTILEASFIFKNLHDTKELHIAISQLNHSSIYRTYGRRHYMAEKRRRHLHEDEDRPQQTAPVPEGRYQLTITYTGSVLLPLVQICKRFLSTMLLLISKNYTGLIIHSVVTNIEDILRESVFWSRLDQNPSSLPSNPLLTILPEGVKERLWVYFNQSSKVFKGMTKWTSFYTIPSTLIFLFSYTAFTRTESNSSAMCSNSSHIGNFSYQGTMNTVTSIWNVTEWKLRSDPINAIDFIGGMDMGAILVVVLLLLSFCLEGLQKYMQSCKNDSLDISKYIKICENMHAFSCLFKEFEAKSKKLVAKSKKRGNKYNTDQNIDVEIARHTDTDSFLFQFMTLILVEDSDFEEGSDFHCLKESIVHHDFTRHSKYQESVQHCNFVAQNVDQSNPDIVYMHNLIVSLRLIVNEFVKKDSEAMKLFEQHETDFISRLPDWSIKIRKQEENFALSILNEMQKNDRLVRGPKSKKYLLSQIFKSILSQTNKQIKYRDLNLFAFFGDIFEYQMCEISSIRLQATLRLLRLYADLRDY